MLRPLWLLAGFLLTSTASAATLSWEAETADACLSPPSVERQVEARLGRKLSLAGPSQALRVRVETRGKSWVASIEMRDAAGAVLGRRVLTVSDDPCGHIEGFVALALALMIDPEAALLPSPPEEAPAPVTSAGDESPPAPPPEAQPEPARPQVARVFGTGKTTVYVFPAVAPRDLKQAWPRNLPTEPSTRLAQRLLTQRLLQREVYTLVEAPEAFDGENSAESYLRSARQQKPASLPTAEGTAPTPDFALIPSIEELTIQSGHDYSLGTRSQATVVALKLRVFACDFKRRRVLDSFVVKTGFSLAGDKRDAKLRDFGLQLALEKSVDDMLDALRSEPQFRIRPRVVEEPEEHVELASLRGVKTGDRFEFVSEDGERSGLASVYDVEGSRARLRVWDRGRGERVMLLARARRTLYSVSLQTNYRLAYAEPSSSEVAAAATQMRRARHFGAGVELGFDWKVWHEPASGSAWRSLLDVGWTFIVANNLALNIEAKAGGGYEIPLLPAAGIGFTPYAAVGVMGVRGALGDEDKANGAKLEALLGATGTLGAQFEFYRLLGDFSLLAAAEFTYVQPILSLTPRDAFIDGRYPSLHAIGLRLGCVWRPADYSN